MFLQFLVSAQWQQGCLSNIPPLPIGLVWTRCWEGTWPVQIIQIDQRDVRFHVTSAQIQKLKERRRKGRSIHYLFVFWRNHFTYWNPSSWEADWHHLLTEVESKSVVFLCFCMSKFCFHFIKLPLLWPMIFKFYFFHSVLLKRGMTKLVGKVWHPAKVNPSEQYFLIKV